MTTSLAGRQSDQKVSVDRALRLLSAFDHGETVGVTELARRAGLPKSTTHRLLASLEQRNVVVRTGSGYRLGLQLFELGNRVPVGPLDGIRDIALPFVAELYEETHQNVHLGVLDNEVVYLLKVHGPRSLSVPTRIGARMPAHCTGIGKVLCAYSSRETILTLLGKPLRGYTAKTLVRPSLFFRQLERIRADGVAWDWEETQYGLGCVAAPIVLGAQGQAVAAISIAGRPQAVEPHVDTVKSAAWKISAKLQSAA